MELDILAFGAHPDDVEFSCAGTMLAMHRKGYKTGIVDVTRGELSTRGTARSRAREADAAAKIMGLAFRSNLALPDGNIERSQRNVLKVITALRELRPRIVLLPSETERHPDHEHAAQLVREACYYAGLRRVATNVSGDPQPPHRPELLLHYIQGAATQPDIVVDVTDVFEQRMQAACAYASQLYDPKSKQPETFISRPEFLEHLEARAREHGFRIGVKYGEGFVSRTTLWCDDLCALLPPKPRIV